MALFVNVCGARKYDSDLIHNTTKAVVEAKAVDEDEDYVLVGKETAIRLITPTGILSIAASRALALEHVGIVCPAWAESPNGGGLKTEALLFEGTSLGRSMVKELYPIAEGEVVYADMVHFKADAGSEQKYVSGLAVVSVLAVPLLVKPRLQRGGRYTSKDFKTVMDRFRLCLTVAKKNGVDCLILDTYEGNPPREVAKIYKTLLAGEFKDVFANVYICIGQGNAECFNVVA